MKERLGQKLRRLGVALQSPILVREMRALLRGRKFFVSHMLLLTVLAGVLLIAATTAAAGSENEDPAHVGRVLYWAFFVGLSVVIIFLVPAFSCTAITTEREGKTLDLLLTTTIRPWEVIWGKLLSAMTVILLFMASALPLVTVCFLFGGVSPWDLAVLYMLVLFGTLVVSSVSLSVSAHCQESKSSVVISYVLTLIIVVGMVAVYVAIAGALFGSGTGGRGASAFSAVFTGYDWREQALIFLAPAFLGLSVFAGNFAAATNRLKPATANRSTNVRVIWMLFLMIALLFYWLTAFVETDLGKVTRGDWSDWLVWSLSVAAPLFWLGAIYFASEEALLPPRVAEDSARLNGPLLPLRIFMPGPLTGVAYAAFFVGLVLGGLTFFNSMFASDAGASEWAWQNLCAAVPLALFLLASASIAALFSSFGFTHRGAGLATFGATALLAFGPLILLAVKATTSTYGSTESTLWGGHYLSPVVAMVGAWGLAGDAWQVVKLPGGMEFPLWAVTSVAYGMLTAVVWATAGIRIYRLRARWQRSLSAPTASDALRVAGAQALVPAAIPVPEADAADGEGSPAEER